MAVAFLIAVGLAIYAFIQKNLAQLETKIATANATEAKKQTEEAKKQRGIAQANAIVATREKNTAVEQRNEAIRQRNIAFAHQLAIKAEFLQNDKAGLLPQSMFLAAESLRRTPSLEAERTLRRGLALLPSRIAEAHYDQTEDSWFMSASRGNRLLFISPLRPHSDIPAVHLIEFRQDLVVDLATWTMEIEVSAMALDRFAQRAALGGVEGDVYLWDLPPVYGPQKPAAQPRKVFNCKSAVHAVAVSTAYIAVGCDSSTTLHLVDLSSGTTKNLGNNSDGVVGLAFSFDEKELGAARANGSLVVWRTDSWEQRFRTQGDLPGAFHATSLVAFSPDASVVTKAMAVDKVLHVWDVKSGKEISRLSHGGSVLDVDFSEDGGYIATASVDGYARVFRIATGGQEAELRHQGAVRSVRFAESDPLFNQAGPYKERLLVTASEDRTARVWEVGDGREVSRVALPAAVGWALPQSHTLKPFAAFAFDGTAALFRGSTEEDLPSQGRLSRPIATYWSPGDNAFIVASANGWSAKLDPLQRKWTGFFGEFTPALAVESATASADGRLLLLAGKNRFEVWDTRAGHKLVDRPWNGYLPDPALSGDGHTVTFPASNKEIQAIHVGEERPFFSFTPPKYFSGKLPMAVSHRYMALAADTGDFVVHDMYVNSAAMVSIPKLKAKAMAFSPNERWLAWAGERPGVLELSTRRELPLEASGDMRNGDHVLFAADGSRVAMTTSRALAVWSIPGGHRLIAAKLDDKVRGLAFSYDGQVLAVDGEDDTARVWRVADGLELARIELARNSSSSPKAISAIALSGKGEFLVTSTAGEQRLWPLSSELLAAEACGRIQNPLTRAEWNEYAGAEPYPDICSQSNNPVPVTVKTPR